jgi:hypothetical protein
LHSRKTLGQGGLARVDSAGPVDVVDAADREVPAGCRFSR